MPPDFADAFFALDELESELLARQTSRRVYVIRHGSTELNEEDRIRGTSNVQLSELGWREVRSLAERLRDSNIECIFCSDLDRAVNTAGAIAAVVHAPVTRTELLRPWNVGDYTGRASSTVTPKMERLARSTPNVPAPNGESWNTFKFRAFSGVRFALAGSDRRPLALVTHHRVERLLAAWTALGQPSDCELDLDVMFTRGEPPAHAEQVALNLHALAADSLPYAGASVKGPQEAEGDHSGW